MFIFVGSPHVDTDSFGRFQHGKRIWHGFRPGSPRARRSATAAQVRPDLGFPRGRAGRPGLTTITNATTGADVRHSSAVRRGHTFSTVCVEVCAHNVSYTRLRHAKRFVTSGLCALLGATPAPTNFVFWEQVA